MIQILTVNICILLLTLTASAASGNDSRMLLAGGLLLIVTTMAYLREDKSKPVFAIQLSLSLIFAVLSGQWYGCLVLALLPGAGMVWKLLLAEGTCLLYGLLQAGIRGEINAHRIAQLLAGMLLLAAASLGVLLIRQIMAREEQRRYAEQEKLRRASLGEMREMQKNAEMQQQSFYERKNARLLERENISRNIHNSVGHSITAAIMTLDAADLLFDRDPQEAHRRMNDASKRIHGSLDAIRSAVRALDQEDADVSISDLLCYTENIINEFTMDTQLSCDRINDLYSDSLMLPKEHAEFLSGALSELLTNGVKHGNATHFTVKIVADSAHIRLEVTDNGRSDYSEENAQERITHGFGLKKLTSYAQRCGGSTEFFNRDGFFAAIELPVRTARESE